MGIKDLIIKSNLERTIVGSLIKQGQIPTFRNAYPPRQRSQPLDLTEYSKKELENAVLMAKEFFEKNPNATLGEAFNHLHKNPLFPLVQGAPVEKVRASKRQPVPKSYAMELIRQGRDLALKSTPPPKPDDMGAPAAKPKEDIGNIPKIPDLFNQIPKKLAPEQPQPKIPESPQKTPRIVPMPRPGEEPKRYI